MKKIDLRDRSAAGRNLLWPVLALPVGGVILAVAIAGGKPLSPAGVLGAVILVAAITSVYLEVRGTRGWSVGSNGGQLILISPHGVRSGLPAAQVRSAKRVVREVDEFDAPKLWRAIGMRAGDQEGRSMAAAKTNLRGASKSNLQSFVQLQPASGAHWGQRAEFEDIVGARGIEIPMDSGVSDRRLRELFDELGIEYHGK